MDCRIPLHSEALPRIRVGSGGLSDCVSAYLLQHILRHFMGRVSTYFMGKSFRVAGYSTVIPSNSSSVRKHGLFSILFVFMEYRVTVVM